ncbi:MAG TPA: MFS transporter, partial [bacterium]|nr:MFS transporter [bacterium]
GSVSGAIVITMLAAAGNIIAAPYLEASVANLIEDETRAKTMAILTVLILIFISPAGIIGGWTYSINPKIPFIIISAALLTNALLIFYLEERKEKRGKR